uniref:Uncharacterized protein n=1 Tax=Salmonella sp. TaxID=599 RepID=A0A482ETH9_SALSP|nr:hypothetical protein NNIBIDOC_00184 [Salmonella sp.]
MRRIPARPPVGVSSRALVTLASLPGFRSTRNGPRVFLQLHRCRFRLTTIDKHYAMLNMLLSHCGLSRHFRMIKVFLWLCGVSGAKLQRKRRTNRPLYRCDGDDLKLLDVLLSKVRTAGDLRNRAFLFVAYANTLMRRKSRVFV